MSMRLQYLQIDDFGPYYGSQHVSFDGDRPITVIHGANMGGKTSISNALRWVLYGRVFDRLQKQVPRVNLSISTHLTPDTGLRQ